MDTDWTDTVREIVRYLNEKSLSSFRAASAATKRPIVARLNEGYREKDFRAVIDAKTAQWMGNETMERYLRPQTLFGTKMESYLQEARRATRQKNRPTAGFRSAKELMDD